MTTETNGVDLDRIVHGLHLDLSSMRSELAEKDRSDNAQTKLILQNIGKFISDKLKPLQKEIADLKAQVAELQAGGVKFSGNHQRGNEYRRGEIAAYDNAVWCAVADAKPMQIPGTCAAWQLALRGQPDAAATDGPRQQRAAHMTDDRINDLLLDMVGTVLKDRAETLLGQGLTDDELNARLASYIPEANKWRADTLRFIKRATE